MSLVEEKIRNLCLECGVDMGPQNPRQLCGKLYCLNEAFIGLSDNEKASITNDEETSNDNKNNIFTQNILDYKLEEDEDTQEEEDTQDNKPLLQEENIIKKSEKGNSQPQRKRSKSI